MDETYWLVEYSLHGEVNKFHFKSRKNAEQKIKDIIYKDRDDYVFSSGYGAVHDALEINDIEKIIQYYNEAETNGRELSLKSFCFEDE